jgi:hypothetical protein
MIQMHCRYHISVVGLLESENTWQIFVKALVLLYVTNVQPGLWLTLSQIENGYGTYFTVLELYEVPAPLSILDYLIYRGHIGVL